MNNIESNFDERIDKKTFPIIIWYFVFSAIIIMSIQIENKVQTSVINTTVTFLGIDRYGNTINNSNVIASVYTQQ